MTITMLGVDLGKNSVSVVGLDDRGAVVLWRRVTRNGPLAMGKHGRNSARGGSFDWTKRADRLPINW
jgi:hypothetical protein